MFQALYLFLLAQLLAVAYWDFRFQKISNWWLILNCCLFLVLMIVWPQDYPFHPKTALYPLALLGVGFVFFLMKIMGAGDVKYLFGFFLLIPATIQEEALFLLIYSTIVVGSILLLIKILPNVRVFFHALMTRQWMMVKRYLGGKNVFAPVVLLAWIWLGWQKWNVIFQ